MSQHPDHIERRTILQGAAWSVPVMAAAVATPVAVASPGCPRTFAYRAAEVDYQFTNLTAEGRWRADSSLRVVARVGSTVLNLGGLSYASDEAGATVATIGLNSVITFTVRVSWTTVPAGWTVTEAVLGGGQWRYTFTRTSPVASISALSPITNRPTAASASNAVPITTFIGAATNTPFTVGQLVANGPTYSFPWTYSTTYNVSNARSACNTGQVTVNSGDFTITNRPVT
ncbi:hypothetical protein [Pseudoclavibacter terrae]|uniref:Uncharacterized protein n=1 Tax=Pseudoclavibacter terrae TaxID=1530195 RepID=A0A7J5B4W0_9MICO|nr:hypothetical protein [Pseudoclavibacter terrae]KAB1639172.1 hypothetical protein F8O03_02175 [Pseudoclavibacter terrae]